MNFQRIVIYVALAILIVLLAIVGFMLYQYKENITFPPEISECPDYWKVIGVEQCQNIQNLGNGAPQMMDFSSPEYQGKVGMKNKKQWALQYSLTWDGITNNQSLN